MENNISIKWNENMAFDVDMFDGINFRLDASAEHGGNNSGHRPKPLILVALAGCTAMDVISILGKMKIKPDDFQVDVNGLLSDEHPKTYIKMHIKYVFAGTNLEFEKLEKAVLLSKEKYCGVSALLEKALKITYEIIIK